MSLKRKVSQGMEHSDFSLEKQADVLVDKNCTTWLSYKNCCDDFGNPWMFLFVISHHFSA